MTIDLGSHRVLDQLRLWLGDVTVTGYRDDAFGGVEADAVVELEAGGVPGMLELSRTRALGSLVEIECERGATTQRPPATSTTRTRSRSKPSSVRFSTDARSRREQTAT